MRVVSYSCLGHYNRILLGEGKGNLSLDENDLNFLMKGKGSFINYVDMAACRGRYVQKLSKWFMDDPKLKAVFTDLKILLISTNTKVSYLHFRKILLKTQFEFHFFNWLLLKNYRNTMCVPRRNYMVTACVTWKDPMIFTRCTCYCWNFRLFYSFTRMPCLPLRI